MAPEDRPRDEKGDARDAVAVTGDEVVTASAEDFPGVVMPLDGTTAAKLADAMADQLAHKRQQPTVMDGTVDVDRRIEQFAEREAQLDRETTDEERRTTFERMGGRAGECTAIGCFERVSSTDDLLCAKHETAVAAGTFVTLKLKPRQSISRPCAMWFDGRRCKGTATHVLVMRDGRHVRVCEDCARAADPQPRVFEFVRIVRMPTAPEDLARYERELYGTDA